MKIHIACDHAGFDYVKWLIKELSDRGHEVVDHGPKVYDPEDDYPSFCIAAAEAVVTDQKNGIEALGIVFGGSGNGEQIAANKVKGVRAALAWNADTARLAREHNNANVIAIGARQHSKDEVLNLLEIFLSQPFPGEARHVRRINQLADYEAS